MRWGGWRGGTRSRWDHHKNAAGVLRRMRADGPTLAALGYIANGIFAATELRSWVGWVLRTIQDPAAGAAELPMPTPSLVLTSLLVP